MHNARPKKRLFFCFCLITAFTGCDRKSQIGSESKSDTRAVTESDLDKVGLMPSAATNHRDAPKIVEETSEDRPLPTSGRGVKAQEDAQRIVTEYLDQRSSRQTKVTHYKWSKAVTGKAGKHVLEADISPDDLLTVIYHEYREYEALPNGGLGTIGPVVRRKFYIKDNQVVMVTR